MDGRRPLKKPDQTGQGFFFIAKKGLKGNPHYGTGASIINRLFPPFNDQFDLISEKDGCKHDV